jgi:hypothetical protein
MNKNKIEVENHRMVGRITKASTQTFIDNVNTEREKILKIHQARIDKANKARINKIQNENLRILEHIILTPSAYDHTKWEKEAIERENILKNMTEFPELFEKTRATITSSGKKSSRPSTAGMVNKLQQLVESQRPMTGIPSRMFEKRLFNKEYLDSKTGNSRIGSSESHDISNDK